MSSITQILGTLIHGDNLSFDSMKSAMDLIMEGKCTNAQIGAFLALLRAKGETPEEIAAAVEILRQKSTKVLSSKPNLVDTCGTGGDHSGSFNISTTSAIIAAAAGAPIAKHGNKAMSSNCGSANVLQTLGLNLDLTPEQVGESIDKHNIGFLFAMKLHNAMRFVGPVRQELGQRTLFNILGPMINPAGAKRQVIGVFDGSLTRTLAEVLQKTGSEHVLVVAGQDGMDEISLTANTNITELKNNTISDFEFNPEELGLQKCTADQLKGGSPEKNAAIIRDILNGDVGPKRDIAILNAGAALYVSGLAPDIKTGAAMAGEAVDSGKAKETLKQFVAFSL